MSDDEEVPSDRSSAQADAIGSEPGWLRLSERWSASTPTARALCVVTAVLVVGALVAADLAAHAHPARRTTTVYAPAGPGPVTVDAAGCPVRQRCTVRNQGAPAIAGAIRHAFRDADVRSAVATLDVSTGRVYRRVVVARVGPAKLVVSAQCIPGGGVVSRRTLPADPTNAGRPAAGTPTQLVIVVPGHTGCSATVEADTSASPSRADPAHPMQTMIVNLADDPVLQLSP